MWRRLLLFASGVVVTLVAVVYAQVGQQDARDHGSMVQEARRTAQEVLAGRSLAVRVYPDPQNDSDRSVLVNVPIRNLSMRFNAIETAYPSITEAAYVLIQAADQTDGDIAAVLDRYVCLQPYSSQHTQSLWFRDERRQYPDAWTFFDAIGDPMAGAAVEILLRPYRIEGISVLSGRSEDNRPASIRLSSHTLDDEGRLMACPAVGGLPWITEIIVRVSHADYGVATVRALTGVTSQTNIYVVPMVPRESGAFSSSLRGTVADSAGRALANMPVSISPNMSSTDDDCYSQLFEARVFTDEQGRFALCPPKLSRDFMLSEPAGPGTPYVVRVEPPRSLNLRQLTDSIYTGAPATLTLTAMDAGEMYHTFSFEYHDGPVTERDELAHTVLTLERDGRQWRKLTYDRFANGCTLPSGTLSAQTTRWGKPFEFMSIELDAGSPEHLVFTTGAPVVYRGRVVEFGTNRPMPGVFVLASHSLARREPNALTAEQWRLLAAQADSEAKSQEILYQERDRVAVTDKDGVFEIVFAPGGGRVGALMTRLSSFTAFAPGYAASAARPHAGSDRQNMTVPTLELCRPGMVYFPQFVFEDENGPVTDPNRLDKIDLAISEDHHTLITTAGMLLKDHEFVAGEYRARATWDDKRYVFDPVDLTTARPSIVVFTPASIEPLNLDAVTYRGLVVDETTGKPLGGALAVCCGSTLPPGVKGLRPEEWAAIEALGPNPDPADPAFARFWTAIAADRQNRPANITATDENGWFELTTAHSPGQRGSFVYVLARDHLAGFKTLAATSGGRGGEGRRDALVVNYAPDENGVAILPTFSLIPAATVLIHPIVPDPGHASRVHEPILRWSAAPEDPTAHWIDELNGRRGGIQLQPNVEQVALVPSGVTLRLRMEISQASGLVNVSLGRIRLQKGQVYDLGRPEFNTGIPIVVSVLDGAGASLSGASVACMDEEMWMNFRSGKTDESGAARVSAPAYGVGRIRAYVDDPVTGERIEDSVPFTIGGIEDAGKEFIVRLSGVSVGP